MSVLRGIKPTESRRIRERFDLPHAVAFLLHDELAHLVIDLEKTGALFVRFELDEEEQEKFENLSGEKLWNWLKETGRDDVLLDLTYRQLTAAVISDAAHFIYESLLSGAKGKMAVAYSLLRKPLKENLLLLEWLCAEPASFLDHFNGESIEPYVLNRLSKSFRLKIMQKAVQEVDSVLNADFLWTVRYAKGDANSLETLWTQATHLVTTVQASATEPGNLNFVFANPATIEVLWEKFYTIVPLLLQYFLDVAEKVVSRFCEWDTDMRPLQLLRRELACIRLFEETSALENVRLDVTTEDVWRQMNVHCDHCDTQVPSSKDVIDACWLNAVLWCPTCGDSDSLWDLALTK